MTVTDSGDNKRDAAVRAVADVAEDVAAAHAQWKAAIVRRNSLLRDARETLGVDGKPPTLVRLQLAGWNQLAYPCCDPPSPRRGSKLTLRVAVLRQRCQRRH